MADVAAKTAKSDITKRSDVLRFAGKLLSVFFVVALLCAVLPTCATGEEPALFRASLMYNDTTNAAGSGVKVALMLVPQNKNDDGYNAYQFVLHYDSERLGYGAISATGAQQADELLFRCRSAAAELFSVPSSEQVVFTMNATHGLNIAIKSLVRPCGRVVVSGYEHNAVTRPLHALGAEVIVAAAPLFSPQETVEAFERALAHEPDAVICTHVSNVFGAILPIERIAQLCRGASVPLIIDASQSAGSLPIDFSALAPAFLAMPGHKGLYGPQGTGLLLCGSDALPLIEGGTGSESLRQSMPDFLPDRLEAGTHNVPGIAGLEAGIAFVRAQRPERILHHSRALIRRAGEGLGKIPNVHGFLSLEASLQAGVLSFTVDGLSPESVAEEMAKRGIALRAGLHCAPFAHKTVGTLPDGTVRLSVSAFNRESEIDTFLSSLRAIAAGQAKN